MLLGIRLAWNVDLSINIGRTGSLVYLDELLRPLLPLHLQNILPSLTDQRAQVLGGGDGNTPGSDHINIDKRFTPVHHHGSPNRR